MIPALQALPNNKLAFIGRSANFTGNSNRGFVAGSGTREERPVNAMRGADGGAAAGQGWTDLSSRARDGGGLGRKIEAFFWLCPDCSTHKQ